MQYFGERLRDLRHEKHMTQKQLADKIKELEKEYREAVS